jgi:hypothetical protein
MAILKGSPIFRLRFSPKEELIEYHLQFLRRLRQRQGFVQYSSLLGDQLRSIYGEFCSRYQEAVSMYRETIKDDREFVALQCTMNPLYKKRGIPECILFVTQRITDYPLFIDLSSFIDF